MNSQTSTRPDTTDDILSLLSDHHRRAVLSYFRDTGAEVATLDELVDHVGAREDRDDRELAILLHHATLPQLAKADVVEYDARSNTVRYYGDYRVATLLELVQDC